MEHICKASATAVEQPRSSSVRWTSLRLLRSNKISRRAMGLRKAQNSSGEEAGLLLLVGAGRRRRENEEHRQAKVNRITEETKVGRSQEMSCEKQTKAPSLLSRSSSKCPQGRAKCPCPAARGSRSLHCIRRLAGLPELPVHHKPHFNAKQIAPLLDIVRASKQAIPEAVLAGILQFGRSLHEDFVANLPSDFPEHSIPTCGLPQDPRTVINMATHRFSGATFVLFAGRNRVSRACCTMGWR